ncbi:hypothetical protein CLOM_g2249 [Closterium sp. NIES-68]|nr:hypothetical protein CLOM_g2249 [Closterium sp. NIES-68]GJP58046.1 hypothetical protein CLOP_g20154 [Closterium sp. NIES-67]
MRGGPVGLHCPLAGTPCQPHDSTYASLGGRLASRCRTLLGDASSSRRRPGDLSRRQSHGRLRFSARCELAPPPKIAVRGLSRRAASTGALVLDAVSLDVAAGQLFGLIGPSGSGKSTLLRAINRLWEPERGRIFVDGRDVTGMDVQQLRRRVGMVFQSPHLFPGTVADNVRYGPALQGIALGTEDLQSLLLRAGLDPSAAFLQRSALELSGGEAQRVSIARALANSPEVFLLDEPTSSLDPTATRKVEETMERLRRDEGLTVVVVSHSMPQIERVADVTALLSQGRVVEIGPPGELRDSDNPDVASFFTGELS